MGHGTCVERRTHTHVNGEDTRQQAVPRDPQAVGRNTCCCTPTHLDEVLQAEVVDALGGEDDPGARGQDPLDLLLRDVHLPLPDLFHLLRVRHHHLRHGEEGKG